jgi:hypothetical protein
MKSLWDHLHELEAKISENLTIPEYLFLTEAFDVAGPVNAEVCRLALKHFRMGYESGYDDARVNFEVE